MSDPTARPERGPEGYAFPTGTDKFLRWADAEERLRDSRAYWLATTNADGTPRVRPVWGVWLDGCWYFDGHPATQWAQNIARDPRANIHLESGSNAVIVEGVVEDIEAADPELGARIVSTWTEKYGSYPPDPVGRGIFRLVPTRARGWSEDLKDGTVWTFEGRPS
jgi:general stress protein 26